MCWFHIEEKITKHFHFDVFGQEQAQVRIRHFYPMSSICLKLMVSAFSVVCLVFVYFSLHDVWSSLLLSVDDVSVEGFILIHEHHQNCHLSEEWCILQRNIYHILHGIKLFIPRDLKAL